MNFLTTMIGYGFLFAAGGFVLIQSILVLYYYLTVRRESSLAPSDSEQNVAVLLCVRGLDPSLPECFRAIANQDYDRKTFLIVGDSASDPAIVAAGDFLKANPDLNGRILINKTFHSTCSLKCSNLIHAFEEIGNEFEFVALIDADTRPPKNWLRMMIHPFEDPKVAVTTGIRWFRPVGKLWGTTVRYIWNAAAIVQMVCYRIPWGGSLAIRTQFVREGNVLEEWKHGFCEDTMLQRLTSRQGMRVEVVSDAVIPTDEQTTVSDCLPWISRQLLTTRLHHQKWPMVLGHGVFTAVLTFGSLILGLATLFSFWLYASLLFFLTYALIQITNWLLLAWIESPLIRKTHVDRSEISAIRFRLGILVTQVCYAAAMLRTVLMRRETWRQISYRIRGKSVEMEDYQPYEQADQTEISL